ncbi:MAG: hypothetical protein ABI972_02985 [Acidobacteriota bacterium]
MGMRRLPVIACLICVGLPAQEPRGYSELCDDANSEKLCWRLEVSRGRVVSSLREAGRNFTPTDLGAFDPASAGTLANGRFPTDHSDFPCGARAIVSYGLPKTFRARAPGTDVHVDFFDCAGKPSGSVSYGDRVISLRQFHLDAGPGARQALVVGFAGGSSIAFHCEVWVVESDGRPKSVLSRNAKFVSATAWTPGSEADIVLAVLHPANLAVNDQWVKTKFVWNPRSRTFAPPVH